MASNFLRFTPQSRVNITLDVLTDGCRQQKELPLKLLVLGDFSHGQQSGTLPLRSRLNIHKDNFNQVLKTLSPRLSIQCEHDRVTTAPSRKIELTIQQYQDFQPHNIAKQIPELRELMAMRNVLKDLKACLMDNQQFCKALEKVIQDKRQRCEVQGELKAVAPLEMN